MARVTVPEVTCGFNGAADNSADRWDPRFTCRNDPVWHVLIGADVAAHCVLGGQEEKASAILLCEDHCATGFEAMAMYHRVEPNCLKVGVWRHIYNRCDPPESWQVL